MTTTPEPAPLREATAAADLGRRRAVAITAADGDVLRMRGVAVASVLAAFAVLVAVVLALDPAGTRAPGPLSHPHAQAGLSCASCHEAEAPGAACVTCHGPHPSVRAGHRKRAGAGALGCTTCHREHRDLGGVTLLGSGRALRFVGAATREVAVSDVPVATVSVPVVPLSACRACHDPTRIDEPIRRCVPEASGGSEAFSACLDEHTRLDDAALARGGTVRLTRDALVRQAVAAAPNLPATPPASPVRAVIPIAAGLLLGGVGLWIARLRRRPAPAAAPPPVPAAIRKLPVVDTTTCIGCSACVDACPFDVLTLRRYVAVVERPADCCGVAVCEQRCPNGSLRLVTGEALDQGPRLDDTLQSRDVPGLWLAGDLTGVPLVRNAIAQGRAAVEAVATSLRGAAAGQAHVDVAIVGAGPAGLSAALAAIRRGLSYVVLEQDSVAASIRSFPRHKLVLDAGTAPRHADDLWIADTTKEELVARWSRTVRERGLSIVEGARVTAIDRRPEGDFHVVAETADGPRRVLARRIVLAIGRRGTPRRLAVPIPDAVADRVHTFLADAHSFAGQRVVVVGLGDVAMEAALALAHQPGTTVTVVYRGLDFARGKARNVEAMRRALAQGKIAVHWSSEIREVGRATLHIAGPSGAIELPWDALFVLIGTLVPWDFLRAVGVGRAPQPSAPRSASPAPVAGTFSADPP